MDEKEIYAFWEWEIEKNEKRKESLAEHVSNGMAVINSSFKPLLLLTENDKKWLKVAWIFHDIGKIFFQGNYRKNYEKKKERLSFVGHEFISTFVADVALNEWVSQSIEERIKEYMEYRCIVLGSILYHHHAMNLQVRRKILSELPSEAKLYDKDKWESYREFEGKVKEVVRNIFEKSKILKSFCEKVGSFNPLNVVPKNLKKVVHYVEELNNEIWTSFVGNKEFRKKFLLFEQIIITADYKAASESRGPSHTFFGKTVNEFWNIYKDYIQKV